MRTPRNSIRASGVRRLIAFGALATLLSGCWWYGFAGGGLPDHVKTVAVLPFDNETTSPELQRELYDELRRRIQSQLGLREAPEARADAIVRGAILRYETDVPISFSADRIDATSARRRLQVTVDVEIMDQVTGRTLWQRKGLSAEGEYNERGEATGRRLALEKLVTDVIDGAQSQW